MPKPFIRIVSLLVIPWLLADPAIASAFSGPITGNIASGIARPQRQIASVFQEQALIAKAIGAPQYVLGLPQDAIRKMSARVQRMLHSERAKTASLSVAIPGVQPLRIPKPAQRAQTLKVIMESLGQNVFIAEEPPNQQPNSGWTSRPFQLSTDGIQFFQEYFHAELPQAGATLISMSAERLKDIVPDVEASENALLPVAIAVMDVPQSRWLIFDISALYRPVASTGMRAREMTEKPLQEFFEQSFSKANHPTLPVVHFGLERDRSIDGNLHLLALENMGNARTRGSTDFQKLLLADKQLYEAQSVLDVGTGSGVQLLLMLQNGAVQGYGTELTIAQTLIARWNVQFTAELGEIPVSPSKVHIVKSSNLDEIPPTGFIAFNTPPVTMAPRNPTDGIDFEDLFFAMTPGDFRKMWSEIHHRQWQTVMLRLETSEVAGLEVLTPAEITKVNDQMPDYMKAPDRDFQRESHLRQAIPQAIAEKFITRNSDSDIAQARFSNGTEHQDVFILRRGSGTNRLRLGTISGLALTSAGGNWLTIRRTIVAWSAQQNWVHVPPVTTAEKNKDIAFKEQVMESYRLLVRRVVKGKSELEREQIAADMTALTIPTRPMAVTAAFLGLSLSVIYPYFHSIWESSFPQPEKLLLGIVGISFVVLPMAVYIYSIVSGSFSLVSHTILVSRSAPPQKRTQTLFHEGLHYLVANDLIRSDSVTRAAELLITLDLALVPTEPLTENQLLPYLRDLPDHEKAEFDSAFSLAKSALADPQNADLRDQVAQMVDPLFDDVRDFGIIGENRSLPARILGLIAAARIHQSSDATWALVSDIANNVSKSAAVRTFLNPISSNSPENNIPELTPHAAPGEKGDGLVLLVRFAIAVAGGVIGLTGSPFLGAGLLIGTLILGMTKRQNPISNLSLGLITGLSALAVYVAFFRFLPSVRGYRQATSEFISAKARLRPRIQERVNKRRRALVGWGVSAFTLGSAATWLGVRSQSPKSTSSFLPGIPPPGTPVAPGSLDPKLVRAALDKLFTSNQYFRKEIDEMPWPAELGVTRAEVHAAIQDLANLIATKPITIGYGGEYAHVYFQIDPGTDAYTISGDLLADLLNEGSHILVHEAIHRAKSLKQFDQDLTAAEENLAEGLRRFWTTEAGLRLDLTPNDILHNGLWNQEAFKADAALANHARTMIRVLWRAELTSHFSGMALMTIRAQREGFPSLKAYLESKMQPYAAARGLSFANYVRGLDTGVFFDGGTKWHTMWGWADQFEGGRVTREFENLLFQQLLVRPGIQHMSRALARIDFEPDSSVDVIQRVVDNPAYAARFNDWANRTILHSAAEKSATREFATPSLVVTTLGILLGLASPSSAQEATRSVAENAGFLDQATDLLTQALQTSPWMTVAVGVVVAIIVINIEIHFLTWLWKMSVLTFYIETREQKAYGQAPSPATLKLIADKLEDGDIDVVWGPGITPEKATLDLIHAAQKVWRYREKYHRFGERLSGVRIVVVNGVDLLGFEEFHKKTFRGSYMDSTLRTLYVSEGYWAKLTDDHLQQEYFVDWLTRELYRIDHPDATNRQAWRFARTARALGFESDEILSELAYEVSQKRRDEEYSRFKASLVQDDLDFVARVESELGSSEYHPETQQTLAPGGPWTRLRRPFDKWVFRLARWLHLPISWTEWYLRKAVYHSVVADIDHEGSIEKTHRQALQKLLGQRPEERVAALQLFAQMGNFEENYFTDRILQTLEWDEFASCRLAAAEALVPMIRRSNPARMKVALHGYYNLLRSLIEHDPHISVRQAAEKALRELEALFPSDRGTDLHDVTDIVRLGWKYMLPGLVLGTLGGIFGSYPAGLWLTILGTIAAWSAQQIWSRHPPRPLVGGHPAPRVLQSQA